MRRLELATPLSELPDVALLHADQHHANHAAPAKHNLFPSGI
jgi:hypothetical protein